MRFSTLLLLAVIFSCTKPTNRFEDETFRKIAEFQDRRLTDSLRIYLNSEDSRYRAAAALAFGSVQDTLASRPLGDLLLEDEDPLVRRNAAWALGQAGGIDAVNALIPAMTDTVSIVVREVLEALGKTISADDLHYLFNYQADDSVVLAGQAWAFYRLGIRGLADSLIVSKASNLLTSQAMSVRHAAAQFFSRTSPVGTFNPANLIRTATKDPFPEVRMAAARGLKHIRLAEALPVVNTLLRNDPDYRVRCNALRSVSVFPYNDISELLMAGLSDPNLLVRITASEVILSTMPAADSMVVAHAKSADNWRVRANLYQACLSHSSDTLLQGDVVRLYRESTNDYEKAWLLRALSNSPAMMAFLTEQATSEFPPVVKVAAVEALVSINQKFPGLSDRMISIYERIIENGDPVQLGIIANTLSMPELNYKQIITDIGFLKEARMKLRLPEDMETVRPVDRAIAFLENSEIPVAQNEYNHPIDWTLVSSIPQHQKVRMQTSKGDIVIELLVNEAPGSVANFVQLATDGYFDGKAIHRVVPNFVAQAGCKRGDGYGSEAYSIRSEFSLRRYREGAVGMASAGKDTEGTQWFITHSATPHLDGRYTIFAQAVEGMEVVHALEVGDKVIKATLVDN